MTTTKAKKTATTESIRALVRAHPIMAGVEDEGIEAIVRAGIIKQHRANDVLTREGDKAWAYWFLIAGHTRVYGTSPEGLTVTVKLFAAPAAWAASRRMAPTTPRGCASRARRRSGASRSTPRTRASSRLRAACRWPNAPNSASPIA
jgi:hypothetical protein